MPTDPPPLWDGYDDASEDELLALLERKVDALFDEDDATDERATKDFAQAIASHEWLKENKLNGAGHHPRLHARANEVRIGSWRP
jgi:pterin-4a-carbinolamine dehydratase